MAAESPNSVTVPLQAAPALAPYALLADLFRATDVVPAAWHAVLASLDEEPRGSAHAFVDELADDLLLATDMAGLAPAVREALMVAVASEFDQATVNPHAVCYVLACEYEPHEPAGGTGWYGEPGGK